MSLCEAGEQIGISHMTVARALRGKPTDLGIIESIANWLGVPPSTLIDLHTQGDELVYQISALLSTYPQVIQPAEQLIAKIMDGSVQPEVLIDSFIYASYQANIKVSDRP